MTLVRLTFKKNRKEWNFNLDKKEAEIWKEDI